MTRPRQTMSDPRAGERGQALAMFAGGLVALLVATGFVLDGGIAFMNRREAQNAADLGALAGTHVVAEHHISGRTSGTGQDVYDAIEKAVADNGCTPTGDVPCSWTADYVRPTTGYDTAIIAAVSGIAAIPLSAQGVEVHITSNPSVFFLRAIGQSDWDVTADATAISARIDDPGPGILLPVAFDPGPGRDLAGIDMADFPEPPPVYLFSPRDNGPGNSGLDSPGNFSWLQWGGTNDAPTLIDSVCNPDNPEMAFPTYVPGYPGASNPKEARDCLREYIGQTVYVPFWGEGGERCGAGAIDDSGAASRTDYCILGIAAFELTTISDGHGPAILNMKGRLQKYVNTVSISENFSGPPCNPATDSSCLAFSSYLGLIR